MATYTMPDWRERYRHKLRTADEAVREIRDGHTIRLPMGAVPVDLVEALVRRSDELGEIRVFHGASRYPLPFAQPGWCGSAKIGFICDFVSLPVRSGMESRAIDFLVTDYSIGSRSQYEQRCDIWHPDAFLAPVSEPDASGMVSFGYTLWHSRAFLENARLRIAEVTPGMICTGGENRVPLDRFDWIVERTEPLSFPPLPELSQDRVEVTEVIGAYVSTLVRDGDTIQIGTGTLSSCMGSYLEHKNDLGIDAEILVPSTVNLVKLGVATGRRKTFYPGLATASFIVPGSDFTFCDGNPRIALFDIEWCNHLPRIARIENLVAINQASAIDLTGQVAAESIGPAMYTGPGGQLVWTMGALYAPGGRAVTVLPSTACNGTVSRIVPELSGGTIVTVPRTFVDYVVTEYGIVNLQGRTQRQRAELLTEIAHPIFRPTLEEAARKLFWP